MHCLETAENRSERAARHPRNSALLFRDSPKDQKIVQKPTEPLRLDDVVFVAHHHHRVWVCVLSACVSLCAIAGPSSTCRS